MQIIQVSASHASAPPNRRAFAGWSNARTVLRGCASTPWMEKTLHDYPLEVLGGVQMIVSTW